jgi:hypothetical protein
MECGAAGACTLLGQMRIASDGTEAAVREGGWRMSGVGFLREMGAGPTQVKPRPDESHEMDARGDSLLNLQAYFSKAVSYHSTRKWFQLIIHKYSNSL